MSKICAFTGHRKLNKYDFDVQLLYRVILDLIKTGTTRFLCGMAAGFDLAAAEAVADYKKKYNIELVACLPCANQTDTFSMTDKVRHRRILNVCSEVITISPEYRVGCMHERDRYLVDNSDVLICFLREQSGGTYYTVNYAKKKNKKIIQL